MASPIKEYLGCSTLYDLDAINLPDTLEAHMANQYNIFLQIHEKESSDFISAIIVRKLEEHGEASKDFVLALLYGILTHSDFRQKV